MSDSQQTGGPAFPGPCQHETTYDIHEGMTLRDWFAGMALQGMCANADAAWAKSSWATIASAAYLVADAMLETREQ